MPSKMQQRIQHARDRKCYVFKQYSSTARAGRVCWMVYIEGEYSVRGPMTKREAKNLAYAVSISKHLKLEVVFG